MELFLFGDEKEAGGRWGGGGGGCSLGMSSNLHKAIPANSRSASTAAVPNGGRPQMCPLSLEREKQTQRPLQLHVRATMVSFASKGDVPEAADVPPT